MAAYQDLPQKTRALIEDTPMLTLAEEQDLVLRAKAGEPAAIDRLICAHLRMATRTLRKHKSANAEDLFQESVLGLMRALETFDPSLGWRFSTYARSWIAEFQARHTRHNKTMVRVSESHTHRRGAFHLMHTAASIRKDAMQKNQFMTDHESLLLAAEKLDIPLADVDRIVGYAMGDSSLNSVLNDADGGTQEVIDLLVDDTPGAVDTLNATRNQETMESLLRNAMNGLTAREKVIITERFFAEEKSTLEELGTRFNISKERIRQVEAAALKKITLALDGDKSLIKDLLDA